MVGEWEDMDLVKAVVVHNVLPQTSLTSFDRDSAGGAPR